MLNRWQRLSTPHRMTGHNTKFLAFTLLISGIVHALIIFLPPSAPLPTPIISNANVSFQVSITPITKKLPPITQSSTENTTASSKPPPTFPPSALPPPLQVIPAFADKYYEVRELDTIPMPLAKIEPIFPTAALADGATGVVQLEMFVDEKGQVESLRVVDSTAPGIFDQAAIDAFARQKFQPGIKDNAPVKTHLKLVVNFGEHPRNGAR